MKLIINFFMGCSWVNKRQGRSSVSSPPIAVFSDGLLYQTFHGLFMGEQTAGAALHSAFPTAVVTTGATSTFHGLFMGEQTAGAAPHGVRSTAVFTRGAA